MSPASRGSISETHSMMQHPAPPDGIRIDDEEHARRLAAYHAGIKLALDRYNEWKRMKEDTK